MTHRTPVSRRAHTGRYSWVQSTGRRPTHSTSRSCVERSPDAGGRLAQPPVASVHAKIAAAVRRCAASTVPSTKRMPSAPTYPKKGVALQLSRGAPPSRARGGSGPCEPKSQKQTAAPCEAAVCRQVPRAVVRGVPPGAVPMCCCVRGGPAPRRQAPIRRQSRSGGLE